VTEARYEVRAHNTATASANKIHDDTIAKSLGFRGGLVPGVDVYAYLCHLPAARWGRGWLEGGTMTARLQAPVYDGDRVKVVAADVATPEAAGALELTLSDPTGATCAVGRATEAGAAGAPPDPAGWPPADPPAVPPPCRAEVLTAMPLGSISATFHSVHAGPYLDDIGESLPLFRQEGVAHPGWLLRFANWVLTANVRLGPWIHVESRVEFFSALTDGERLETRALVAGISERGGHHFVDLDVLQLVGDRAVARTAHTAIYQPRGAEAAAI
jgi:hypothetical protein